MADETSRAADLNAAARTSSSTKEFSNVEFLDAALAEPVNILRQKLKELQDLPDSILARRVLIITDYITEDGRDMDVSWNEADDESPYAVRDSLISMLTRVKNILASGD